MPADDKRQVVLPEFPALTHDDEKAEWFGHLLYHVLRDRHQRPDREEELRDLIEARNRMKEKDPLDAKLPRLQNQVVRALEVLRIDEDSFKKSETIKGLIAERTRWRQTGKASQLKLRRRYVEIAELMKVMEDAGKPTETNNDERPIIDVDHVDTNDERKQEDTFQNRPMIKLLLPDHVKSLLVDDWENVTKNNQLVELPHQKASVDKILNDYVEAEQQQREGSATQLDILTETAQGVAQYFNKALGRILLYR